RASSAPPPRIGIGDLHKLAVHHEILTRDELLADEIEKRIRARQKLIAPLVLKIPPDGGRITNDGNRHLALHEIRVRIGTRELCPFLTQWSECMRSCEKLTVRFDVESVVGESFPAVVGFA